ncbi:MAG: hypothetical protein ACYCTL_10315 [Acidimicrobiales bacterium]
MADFAVRIGYGLAAPVVLTAPLVLTAPVALALAALAGNPPMPITRARAANPNMILARAGAGGLGSKVRGSERLGNGVLVDTDWRVLCMEAMLGLIASRGGLFRQASAPCLQLARSRSSHHNT